MSELSKLQGKSKVYKIGELDLLLKPLSLDDMALFDVGENATQKQQMDVTKNIISKTLKASVPDATDEEIKNIGVEYMQPLTEAIMDINNLNEKNHTGVDIKDVITKRKAQVKDK